MFENQSFSTKLVVYQEYLDAAAIAQMFHLHLPSCGPEFESQAHHLCFFKFALLKLQCEKNEYKQKEARIGPFLKKEYLDRFDFAPRRKSNFYFSC